MAQHLDDVLLETNIFLQKIKQDHLYFLAFVGGSPVCLFGVGGYILHCLETSFSDKSFRKCRWLMPMQHAFEKQQ